MGLGHKRGHVDGESVSGRHTTLIGVADKVVKRMERDGLFDEVRPGIINRASGGKPLVTIRRHADKTHADTLRVVFRQAGCVQEVFFHVENLHERLADVVAGITGIVEHEYNGGADVHDRTADGTDGDVHDRRPAIPEHRRVVRRHHRK